MGFGWNSGGIRVPLGPFFYWPLGAGGRKIRLTGHITTFTIGIAIGCLVVLVPGTPPAASLPSVPLREAGGRVSKGLVAVSRPSVYEYTL